MPHELPQLPYNYNALEPFIDEKTMRIHHGKHHQGYVNKLNKALEGHPELQGKSVQELLKNLSSLPADVQKGVRNAGGGHANHSLFWPTLKKGGSGMPSQKLLDAMTGAFGSPEKCKEEFETKAKTLFGSGWCWLVVADGKLEIMTTPNQDSPLSVGKTPILGLDVWEHAYYISYQNRRAEYVEAFSNNINWEQVEKNYDAALQA